MPHPLLPPGIQGLLRQVDGLGPVDEVTTRVMAVLGTLAD